MFAYFLTLLNTYFYLYSRLRGSTVLLVSFAVLHCFFCCLFCLLAGQPVHLYYAAITSQVQSFVVMVDVWLRHIFSLAAVSKCIILYCRLALLQSSFCLCSIKLSTASVLFDCVCCHSAAQLGHRECLHAPCIIEKVLPLLLPTALLPRPLQSF
jgi:hypothetical protein